MAKKVKALESFKLEIEFSPMQGFGGGLRTEWVTATDKKRKLAAGMDGGAGLGNPFLSFWIERDGGKREYYTANICDLLRAAIEKVDGVK